MLQSFSSVLKFNKQPSVAIIGWRGMVGSVLLERMIKKNNFLHFYPSFFSTSKFNQNIESKFINKIKLYNSKIENAYDFSLLKKFPIILTTQGSSYTQKVYNILRNRHNWKGFWIDAASDLRMSNNSIIVLDPINKKEIIRAIKSQNIKNFIGGNCTVSCMLMGIGSLFKLNLVKWMHSVTYQAVSGGGANYINELLKQFKILGNIPETDLPILNVMNKILHKQKSNKFYDNKNFDAPIGGSLIPWIDSDMNNGISKEEWKGMSETNKILSKNLNFNTSNIQIENTCIRIGTIRTHAQSILIKLTKYIPLKEIEQIISDSNKWVKIIPNNKKDSVKYLNPIYVSNTLNIAVGRLRTMKMGKSYISLFTLGDQLLWGAAEPLRRTLMIIIDKIKKHFS